MKVKFLTIFSHFSKYCSFQPLDPIAQACRPYSVAAPNPLISPILLCIKGTLLQTKPLYHSTA